MNNYIKQEGSDYLTIWNSKERELGAIFVLRMEPFISGILSIFYNHQRDIKYVYNRNNKKQIIKIKWIFINFNLIEII